MAYIALGVGFLLVVGLMVGCAIVSTGSGAAVSGTNSAKSSWAGSSNVSGSMTATFANGEIFTGRFFQATSNLTDELGPPKTPLLMGGCCRTLSDDSACPSALLVVIAFEPETRDVSERGTRAFRGAKSLSRHVRVQPGGVGRMRRSRCQ